MVMEVDTATDAGLAKLDAHLLDNSYISGVQASLDDLVVFMTFKAAPAASLKSVSRWYKHIHALLSGSFPGAPGGVKLATAGKNAGGGNNNNNNNNAGGKKDKKKDKKQEKPKEEAKPKKAEPTAEEIAAKKKKACIKEGGKKGQDIAGVNDMGGLEFFCMNIDAPEGDFEYLKFVLEGANAHVEEGSEERKGGSSHVGKCLYSSGLDRLAITTYVPDELLAKIDPLHWMEHILKETAGDAGVVAETSKNTVFAYVMQNPDKNLFSLKMKDVVPSMAINYLRERQCFPEDDGDDSDDDMIFGDDTDFDAL